MSTVIIPANVTGIGRLDTEEQRTVGGARRSARPDGPPDRLKQLGVTNMGRRQIQSQYVLSREQAFASSDRAFSMLPSFL